jgi:hypothetical protein
MFAVRIQTNKQTNKQTNEYSFSIIEINKSIYIENKIQKKTRVQKRIECWIWNYTWSWGGMKKGSKLIEWKWEVAWAPPKRMTQPSINAHVWLARFRTLNGGYLLWKVQSNQSIVSYQIIEKKMNWLSSKKKRKNSYQSVWVILYHFSSLRSKQWISIGSSSDIISFKRQYFDN